MHTMKYFAFLSFLLTLNTALSMEEDQAGERSSAHSHSPSKNAFLAAEKEVLEDLKKMPDQAAHEPALQALSLNKWQPRKNSSHHSGEIKSSNPKAVNTAFT